PPRSPGPGSHAEGLVPRSPQRCPWSVAYRATLTCWWAMLTCRSLLPWSMTGRVSCRRGKGREHDLPARCVGLDPSSPGSAAQRDGPATVVAVAPVEHQLRGVREVIDGIVFRVVLGVAGEGQ